MRMCVCVRMCEFMFYVYVSNLCVVWCVYVCMCVSVCVCMFVYVCVCVCICVHVCMYVLLCVIYVRLCVIFMCVSRDTHVQGWWVPPIHFKNDFLRDIPSSKIDENFIEKREKTRRVDCRHFWLNLSTESKVITKNATFSDLKKGTFLISCSGR